MYLLIKNGNIIECDNLLDVASNFNIEVTAIGEVICDGVKDSISYDPNQWTMMDIFSDFIKHRFSKVIRNAKLYFVIEKF